MSSMSSVAKLEKEFNFCNPLVPRLFAVLGSIFLLVVIALVAVSIGTQEIQTVKPTVIKSPGLQKPFTSGFQKICPEAESCIDYPGKEDGNYDLNTLIDLRLASFGLTLTDLILVCLVLIGLIVLLVMWIKVGYDRDSLRFARITLGAVLLLGTVCLQLAILLIHMHLFYDKWVVAPNSPYSFNNWAVEQRTTSEIGFGASYITLCVAAGIQLIASWTILGSACCWSSPKPEPEEEEYAAREDFSLPRFHVSKTG